MLASPLITCGGLLFAGRAATSDAADITTTAESVSRHKFPVDFTEVSSTIFELRAMAGGCAGGQPSPPNSTSPLPSQAWHSPLPLHAEQDISPPSSSNPPEK